VDLVAVNEGKQRHVILVGELGKYESVCRQCLVLWSKSEYVALVVVPERRSQRNVVLVMEKSILRRV
jgi:hypothetical protein